jgi:hypothetical protein
VIIQHYYDRMNDYILHADRIANRVVTALVFCALLSNWTGSLAQIAAGAPTQRVNRLEILYPEFSPYPASRKALDVVTVDGKETPFVAKDTRLFRYDDQQRLISYNLMQIAQTDEGQQYGGDTLKNSYSYTNGRMTELEGGTQRTYVYPLDDTQRRVLTHTKNGYSYINVDTLRKYSAEGILTEVNIQSSRQVITVNAGNVTKIEQYNVTSGKLEKITNFDYENDHYAPLAQVTFLGEASRNALSKQTILDYSFAEGVRTYTFSYRNQYDDQGRMSQQLEYTEDPTLNQGKAFVSQLRKYYY